MITNTGRKAKQELDILVKSAAVDNRPIVEPFIPEILALCEKFGLSGQSGGSAPFTATALAQTIKKLCLQEPICELTGIKEEWGTVADGLNQNNRCSALFRDSKGAYYLDAIVWKTQNNTTWSGSAKMLNGQTIHSGQYIKSFPFTPKTFYIEVIEEEVAKDDWVFWIRDEKQLDKVFECYKKPF
jgi:hypothetical protein